MPRPSPQAASGGSSALERLARRAERDRRRLRWLEQTGAELATAAEALNRLAPADQLSEQIDRLRLEVQEFRLALSRTMTVRIGPNDG